MPRLAQPKVGKSLDFQPAGVPLFYGSRQQRIVTADPWAFFRNNVREELDKATAQRAIAYIDQAFDFYHAAENPRVGTKPLLYYYSFLNLAKVLLLSYGLDIPRQMRHGISDPKANSRERLRLTGQKVRTMEKAGNRQELFPELWELFGGDASQLCEFQILDILWQVPSIHRTFIKVSGRRTILLPVERQALKSDGDNIWLSLSFRKSDRDVQLTLKDIRKSELFSDIFTRVKSEVNEICFETKSYAGHRRGVDTAIARLSDDIYQFPFTTILTNSGYRLYLVDSADSEWLHPLVAIHAAMFYLGSITRYKPEDFGKIITGGYAWIVEEFLATAPDQYLYMLASSMAGTEVVRPYAIRI